MTMLLDVILIAALLWLAWQTLASADLFRAVVLFVAFGFLVALAWLRLQAPDVALAEAAIGSGLTGALLLSTLKRLPSKALMDRDPGLPLLWRAGLAGVFLAGAVALGFAVWRLPADGAGLSQLVAAHVPVSGVSNPVTAVLLNFRAYDTLLELAVLLAALAAAWSLAIKDDAVSVVMAGPVQQALVRLLAPVMVVIAGTLLWIGSFAPGGAFQAGAMLGGAGVMVALSKPEFVIFCRSRRLRVLASAGLVVFMVVGCAVAFSGRAFLQYPMDSAGLLILTIETAATVSIGAVLAALFARN